MTRIVDGDYGPWMEHLALDEGLSYEEAWNEIRGFEAIAYIDKKHGVMGTLLKKGKEVHFAAYRRFRGKAQVSSRRIREFLQPILDREIFLVTKLAGDESDVFIRKIGFEPLAEAQGVRTFILNEIRYPGAKNHARD